MLDKWFRGQGNDGFLWVLAEVASGKRPSRRLTELADRAKTNMSDFVNREVPGFEGPKRKRLLDSLESLQAVLGRFVQSFDSEADVIVTELDHHYCRAWSRCLPGVRTENEQLRAMTKYPADWVVTCCDEFERRLGGCTNDIRA